MTYPEPIYLDYQASTPIAPEVAEAMQPYLYGQFANPHASDHLAGLNANKAIEKARSQTASLIGSDNDEVFFMSGATEANNLAVRGLLDKLREMRKTTIIVSAIEHKCVLEAANFAQRYGFTVQYVWPDNDGIIQPQALDELIDESVGLVSVMAVNNEIGTIQPIDQLAAIAHQNTSLFHTDAAQAPVFWGLDVDELNVDLLSLSGHKFYGPKGIGALYIRRDIQDYITPILHGGGQEHGVRSGTLPTMLCVGMGQASELAQQYHEQRASILFELATQFWQELKRQIPEIELNGHASQRHPGNLNIHFPGVWAEDMLTALMPNVAASAGSSCNSGSQEPSYVVNAIYDEKRAANSIRFSFGIDQDEGMIRKSAQHVIQQYMQQLELSQHDTVSAM